MGLPTLLPALAPLLERVIERVLPDKEAAGRVRTELARMQQAGELKSTELMLSAILAEAGSADKWTSCARPSFLYVMYFVILSCLGASIAGVWWPDAVTTAVQAVRNLGFVTVRFGSRIAIRGAACGSPQAIFWWLSSWAISANDCISVPVPAVVGIAISGSSSPLALPIPQ